MIERGKTSALKLEKSMKNLVKLFFQFLAE